MRRRYSVPHPLRFLLRKGWETTNLGHRKNRAPKAQNRVPQSLPKGVSPPRPRSPLRRLRSPNRSPPGAPAARADPPTRGPPRRATPAENDLALTRAKTKRPAEDKTPSSKYGPR